MIRLNWKFLAFYGISIIAVLTLFRAVTAYAKANLKAPTSIGGVYGITTELPECIPSEAIKLDIQQSGIYLFANLLAETSKTQKAKSGENKPTLNGRLSNQQISLTGIVPWISNCSHSSGGQNLVKIQAIVEGETIAGKISINSSPEVEFTAQREIAKEEEENKH